MDKLNDIIIEHLGVSVFIMAAAVGALLFLAWWARGVRDRVRRIDGLLCDERGDKLRSAETRIAQMEERPCDVHRRKLDDHAQIITRLDTTIELLKSLLYTPKGDAGAPAAARFRELADGWERMMVQIWKDRLALAGALRTGALRRSVAGSPPSVQGLSAAFSFRYLHYGVYVEGGVGPEFARSRRAADGTLPLLDESWRAEHGLDRPRRRGPAWGGGTTSGRPRKARPWFGKSWAISRRVLAERTLQIAGDEFVGLFDEISE